MGFLPQSYEPPQTGNYMKLQTGDNRFRALGPAIVGNEFWLMENGNRRVVRRRVDEVIDQDELQVDQHGKRERVKHFWAFPVWNYSAKQVQVLEITQRTIQDAIRALAESSDWGEPTQYDLIVKKQGSNLDTEYAVMPTPKTATPPDAIGEFQKLHPNLDALFVGGDPFANGVSPNGTNNKAVATAIDHAIQWAWSDAVRYASGYNMSAAQLKDELKKLGHATWNPSLKPVVEELCIPF